MKSYYPLLPILFLLAGSAVSSWIIPVRFGYLIAGTVLILVCAIGAMEFNKIQSNELFLLLITGYWILLVIQFAIIWQPTMIPYIILTPLMTFGVVVMGPKFVNRNRILYAESMVLVISIYAIMGIIFLVINLVLGIEFPWTGRRILSKYPYRISSVFANPNNFGPILSVGILVSCYLLTRTSRVLWGVTAGFLTIALVMTDAKTSIVGTGCGIILFISIIRMKYGIIASLTTVITFPILTIAGVGSDLYTHTMQFSIWPRINQWNHAIAVANTNPYLGIGFRGDILIDNSFINIILQAGYPAALFYIGAILVSLSVAIWKARHGDLWETHVAAVLFALIIRMTMETFTFGGLSVDSWLLALYIGFAAHSEMNNRIMIDILYRLRHLR